MGARYITYVKRAEDEFCDRVQEEQDLSRCRLRLTTIAGDDRQHQYLSSDIGQKDFRPGKAGRSLLDIFRGILDRQSRLIDPAG